MNSKNNNYEFKRKYVIDNFENLWAPNASYLNINKLFQDETIDEFFNLLLFHRFTPFELYLRRFFDCLLSALPSKFKIEITSFLKYIRNPGCSLKIHYPFDGKINQYILTLKRAADTEISFWSGKRAAVCLSHDVDTLAGYQFSPVMMEMDVKAEIPSVFNFITNGDYKIDQLFVSELRTAGFEVGLHGYRHEMGLAGKPLKVVKTEIETALSYLQSLGCVVKGFRAPTYSINEEMLTILEELGFKYDSSMQTCNGHYHSCGISFPYKYMNRKMWEIPLSIQDDLFFRDARVQEKEALHVIEKVLVQIIEIGGVASFNFHPCLMGKRKGFYKSFLELLNNYRDDIWVVLPRDLCTWLEKR